ncbi:MAG TPA: hypothetical protein VNJ47_12040 [Nevskiales bacterium]|nr:hypothetical protein [Nevskiales bacterium]
MSRFRLLAVLALCLLALAGGYLAWSRLQPAAREVAAEPSLVPMAPLPPARKQELPATAFTAEDRDFIRGLREKFAARIHSKYAQIKAVEQLIAYLMAHYPDDWQDRVYGFLRQLFPALADALYDKFQRLVRYNDWLHGNRAVLQKMSAQQRREALWQARQEAFGADAEEIFAAQRRAEQVRDALAALEATPDLPLEQKMTTYLDAIHAAYGEDAEYLLQSRQTEVMNSFLAVDTVQDDLHALAPDERRVALREIRRAMGMDEAALERWDELDAQRDEAWESGQDYMRERARIQQRYEGAQEEERLRELQDEHFGEEAEIIRSEEAAGFYRYGGRRRYGRE